MNIVVCALFVAAFTWALYSNGDILSPAKLFLFSFFIFHVGALADNSYELWLLLLLVLLVGAVTVMFEALSRPRDVPRYALNVRSISGAPHLLFWIWALSIPAILSEFYMLWAFGGIQGYVNIVANRLIEVRGYGWATTLISTMMAFNVAYFAVGLTRPRSRLWWSAYLAHFLITLAVGLLSGSRGSVLNIFAMQVYCYHYIRGRVRLAWALPVAATLLVFAMILGAVRNGVKLENGAFTTGLEGADQVVTYSPSQMGVLPLQILLNADHLKLAYGMTLVSLVTNAVPRDWWPDKPESGGIYFTKVYTGDAWEGASNLTPTFLGEGIINFGWVLGIVFFVFAYPTLMYFIVVYYRRIVARVRSAPGAGSAIDVVLYAFVLWAAVGLMTGEVTNVLLSLALTRIVPLVVLKAALGYRRQSNSRLRELSPSYTGEQPAVSG